MEQNPLQKKLHIKPGQRILLCNPPHGFIEKLGQMPENASLSESLEGLYDLIQLFVYNKADVDKFAGVILKHLTANGILWVAYPKLSSKLKTDISRDKGWETFHNNGYEGVAIASIDETWSNFRLKKGNIRNQATPAKNEFDAGIIKDDKFDAYSVAIPLNIKDIFGTGGHVRVIAKVDGFSVKADLAPYGGKHYMGLEKGLFQKLAKKEGDIVHIVLEKDNAERVIEPPEELKELLEQNPEAKAFFDSLSFTNRKEYVQWIITAKKTETKQARLDKIIPMLLNGVKHP